MIMLSLPLLIAGCSGANGSAPADRKPSFRAKVDHQQTDQGKIAYYQRGQGRPLLLLTGTGSTLAEWDPALIRLLAAKHRLILVDYPGVGKSSGRVPKSFAAMADQVDRFLVAKGEGPVNILGWSMGGFVAQQLVIRHPERVDKIILAGTNPGGDKAVLGPAWAQALDSGQSSDQEVLSLLYPRNALGRRQGKSFLRRLDRASESGEIPDDFVVSAAAKRRQVAAENPWLDSNNNWQSLAKVEKPILVTAGNSDPVTPPINMRRIAAHLPQGEYRLFRGSHAFLFSARAEFSREVVSFLDR